MRYCEFRKKEVINICDCQKLGHVNDLIFDVCSGKITHIVVPGPGKWFGIFDCDDEIIIDFCAIKQIGPDIILVEVSKDKLHGHGKKHP